MIFFGKFSRSNQRLQAKALLMCAYLLIVACSTTPLRTEAQSRATDAVNVILFDFNADEFASYRVDSDGVVRIDFARNIPDKLYGRILDKLQQDPAIKAVLAGKGGPSCSLF